MADYASFEVIPCRKCKGSGQIVKGDHLEECKACQGTGDDFISVSEPNTIVQYEG